MISITESFYFNGSRLENINVFRFGMLDEQAISRKIDALIHFLKIAKISGDSTMKVRELRISLKIIAKIF